MGLNCKRSLRCFSAGFVLCLWMDLLNRAIRCLERGSFLLPDKIGIPRAAWMEYMVYVVWKESIQV